MRNFIAINYNTIVVIAGTAFLGMTSGMLGVFLMLRKKSLLSDALSHATLPGITIAFLLMEALFGNGKFFPGLIGGALIGALVGMVVVWLIRTKTKLQEDAAIGIVLSIFFGLGVAILGIIQQMSTGHAAGLSNFIYGKAASMLLSDALFILCGSAATLVCILFFTKELSLLCFDTNYSQAQGYNTTRLDMLLLILAVMLIIIGLPAVGLILMIAMLILPAASARFWTHKIKGMLWLSMIFGSVGSIVGVLFSLFWPSLPTGAIIVLSAAGLFVFSLFFGTDRGLMRSLFRDVHYIIELHYHRLLATMQYLLSADQIRKIVTDTTLDTLDVQFVPTISVEWIREHGAWNHLAASMLILLCRMRKIIKKVDINTYQLTYEGVRIMLVAARNHAIQHMFVRAYPEQAHHLPQYAEQDIERWLPLDMLSPLIAQLQEHKPHLFNRKVNTFIAAYAAPAPHFKGETL